MIGRLVGLGAVTGTLSVVPWLGSVAYARRWIRPLTGLPMVQVALVPGAYVMHSGAPGPHLTARLELALAAYKSGKAHAFLCSGGNPPGGRNEARSMQGWLVDRGVDADHIIVDERGINTYHSLARAQQVFGISSMIICSQRYHLPRAVTLGRLLGLDAWGLGESDTLRDHPRTTRRGVVREVGATHKMVRDLITRPEVPLDGDAAAAERALSGPAPVAGRPR